ncbi:MAG: hypothetical protein K6E13_05350 [Lachnospiraceae bacterium]|nr:hypothetical protein [Lachnospiraceae bacterium]
MELRIGQGKFNIPGVNFIDGGFNFCFDTSVVRGKKSGNTPLVSCEILLVSIESGEIEKRIPIDEEYIIGDLCCVSIEGIDVMKYGYLFSVNDEIFMDPCARIVYGREKWADENRLQIIKKKDRSNYLFAGFHWHHPAETKTLHLKKEDMVMYHLNVRSFTAAEKGSDRGTFAGLIKKIPYLKSLGINVLSLMPIYEFEEWIPQDDCSPAEGWTVRESDMYYPNDVSLREPRVNMWGYDGGYYFAPKASFSQSKDAESELKSLIKECHDAGIMVVMDMFADRSVSAVMVADAMRYWVCEYKIDGFTLLGEGINTDILLSDPILKKTYFFKDYFTDEQIENDLYNRLFIQNEEFMYVMRKVIATRQANMSEAFTQIKKQGEKTGFVNYITYHNGFTLKDLFSYAMKHNEDNGEYNRDGNDFNFSTNCGIEGDTRKKAVSTKRMKCIYNAISLMALSQGIPMFLAGDERGNSQNGNNNAYCQDNEIGWVNWKKNKTAEQIKDFTTGILKFRKDHKMIRRPVPMMFKDSMNCGMPDISLHGTDAWLNNIAWNSMEAGVCYCGEFCGEKDNVYMAFNFSNSLTKLALPPIPGKKGWRKVMDTNCLSPFEIVESDLHKGGIQIAPNSIVLLVSE